MRPLIIVVVLVLRATGWADGEPWKEGVTAERQQTARQLLEEGNAQFLERNFATALAKYEAAVVVWDHPAIRFNMVRTLVQLGRLVEAYDNLDLALKYGAEPLEENLYEEALTYQKSLAKQVGEIVVTCTQYGVQLTLDGQPVLTCPGSRTRRLLPGHHQLVGKKAEYLTRSVELVARAGERDEWDSPEMAKHWSSVRGKKMARRRASMATRPATMRRTRAPRTCTRPSERRFRVTKKRRYAPPASRPRLGSLRARLA